ncbi:MAG: hypothetical protein IT181_06575 [Acidobacteria bacterium]|nr:hypothetical protein [Acidobacteriota bacterium]
MTRRAAAYLWAAPTSLPGLLLAVCTGARMAWRDGVLEAHGRGVARWFDLVAPGRGIIAMTLGHVVLARDEVALGDTRAHERVHVAQCERWGAFFVPAYLCASAIAWLRGGDAYYDNVFEVEAWRVAPIGAAAPAVLDVLPASRR